MNKIVRLIFLFLVIPFSFNSATAQEVQSADSLTIEHEIINPSSSINDGQIKVMVKGGLPPYKYQWSNKKTPLNAANASGLIEGIEYTLTVTDSKDLRCVQKITIEANLHY